MLNVLRKVILIGFALLLVCAVGLFGYFQWLKSGALFKLKTFNREEWLSGDSVRDYTVCLPGAYMAHDIVTRVIKTGTPISEVVGLLGGQDFGEAKVAYTLGLCVDSAPSSIVIYLDSDRKVRYAELLP